MPRTLWNGGGAWSLTNWRASIGAMTTDVAVGIPAPSARGGMIPYFVICN